MRIGEIEILGLIDGTVTLPQTYFTGVDWRRQADLLDAHRRLQLPVGCFLLKVGEQRILVDAGVGPRRLSWAIGGNLLDGLGKSGIKAEDVEIVVCTHLHLDHIGWLASDGTPVFPNALVRFGQQDLRFAVDRPWRDANRRIIETLDRFGRLAPISDPVSNIAPGVTTIATPGHTPGHLSVVIAAALEQAVLLGDVVITPRQVEHPEWINTTDVDPAQAADTRDQLWRWLAGTTTRVTGAHFPGLGFGRIEAHELGHRFAPED